MEITDIKSAMTFINSHINYEKKDKLPYKEKFGYKFVIECLEKLNINCNDFKIIHVAGTNGKGSIVTILSHLINESGYSAGAFLSPHIFSLNERVLINKVSITDSLLIKSTRIYKEASEELLCNASFFEVLTLIALISFSLAKCEYIILETGLGGRLDTTNFAEKKTAIISTIDYDHTEILGNNIEKIANEKAGIIKKNNIVIIGKQKKSVYNLLRDKATQSNSVLYSYGKDFFISDLSFGKKGIGFRVRFSSDNSIRIKAPLFSIYQSLNIGISLVTLKALGITFTEASLNNLLSSLSLPGRVQYLFKACHTILDGAHNPHSIKSLMVNLRLNFKHAKCKYLILSINKGKDYIAIVRILRSFFNYIIVCPLPARIKADISRNVFEELSKVHKNTYYESSVYDSYEAIHSQLGKDDLLVITGSFYLIGESLNVINSFD